MYWIAFFMLIYPTDTEIISASVKEHLYSITTIITNNRSERCLVKPILPMQYRRDIYWIEPFTEERLEIFRELDYE